MSVLLFSYGTLLPQHAPREITALVAKLKPVGQGSVRGVLFDFGRYPGAVLDLSSGKKIFGTVFKLPADPGFLDELDKYEGFSPAHPSSSLFIRKRWRVTLTDGRVLRCWIYEYNRRPGSARMVASGRWG